MTKPRKLYASRALRAIVAGLPWILAMYLFFWLDSSGTWPRETPHRGKMSVALLAVGMIATFLALSRINKRDDQ